MTSVSETLLSVQASKYGGSGRDYRRGSGGRRGLSRGRRLGCRLLWRGRRARVRRLVRLLQRPGRLLLRAALQCAALLQGLLSEPRRQHQSGDPNRSQQAVRGHYCFSAIFFWDCVDDPCAAGAGAFSPAAGSVFF